MSKPIPKYTPTLAPKLKPMDVYSSYMDLPLDAAIYCRGHRFAPEAVNYARAITQRNRADDALHTAQRQHDDAIAMLTETTRALRDKMARDPV